VRWRDGKGPRTIAVEPVHFPHEVRSGWSGHVLGRHRAEGTGGNREAVRVNVCAYCQEPLEPGWATCPACLRPTTASLECSGCGRTLRMTWRQFPTCGRGAPWASAASQALASRSSDRTPRADSQTGLPGVTDSTVNRTAVDLAFGSAVARRYERRWV